MTDDWLLVETLGAEPAVVARGRHTKALIPVSTYLRRDPHLMAVQSAVGETVRAGQPLASITPRSSRVIRTEVVAMSDGHIHGVQLWSGSPDADPPERPMPGPMVWDLTAGVATDTEQSLRNSGRAPATDAAHDRAFAEALPARELDPLESEVLSSVLHPSAGTAFCHTWDATDVDGEPISVGFVGRILEEADDRGRTRLICRAMNWRSQSSEPVGDTGDLAQLILDGLARPGVYRALVDPESWTLLKWLDTPCPLYDWRADDDGAPLELHPDDRTVATEMAESIGRDATTAILRLHATGGGWVPLHATLHRVELTPGVHAGLLSLRLPTGDELDALRRDAAPGARR